MNVTYFLIALTFLITISKALDLEKLEALGIQDEFYVSDIAVYFNRVFLAIPRTVCRNNVTHPTLVEVPWKDFNIILKIRINKQIEGQIWARCDDLQNAIALAKEGAKSKLWILDKGNEFCPSKIMAYGMLQNEFLDGEKIELAGIPNEGLNAMVIENGTKLGDHRAFIANIGNNALLVCYLKDLSCDRLRLVEKSNPSRVISVDDLSISKVDAKMYLTGKKSPEVFFLEMHDEFYQKNKSAPTTRINLCGEKLGPSSGLETDLKNGLIYYLTRDYAIARWMTNKPMQAEYHDILGQSIKRMPYVSRIFTDPQGNIYALINPFNPSRCSYETINSSNESNQKKPLERTLKIMKYNRLLDKFL